MSRTPVTLVMRGSMLDCLDCIRVEQELYKELWEIIDMYYGGKNNGENI